MNELKTNIKKMKLSDLHPADYNPRLISESAFDGLGHSISRFGMLSHIVWNKRTGNIVGGHQRYRHLIDMGEEETDVVVVDLDDNEEVALNITLNNRHIRGDFSKDVIEQLRVSEAQLGSAFQQIGLLDLYEYLKDRGYDKQKKEKKPKTGKAENTGKVKEGTEDDEGSGKDTLTESKPQAVITCPHCRSQWKLTDNEVVYNTVTGTGHRVGVK